MTISVNSKKKQVKKSFDELLTDLKTSNSEKVRYNAARILGEMGDSKAVEPLIDVLKHDKNGSGTKSPNNCLLFIHIEERMRAG